MQSCKEDQISCHGRVFSLHDLHTSCSNLSDVSPLHPMLSWPRSFTASRCLSSLSSGQTRAHQKQDLRQAVHLYKQRQQLMLYRCWCR
jgi:hypothetical protein